MKKIDLLITNAKVVNEGSITIKNIVINNGIIEKILDSKPENYEAKKEINAKGLMVLPGVIDDQVHFREPGLTHKADIYSESKAAIAGGITSYMEMPNTNPQTTTQEELQKKFDSASKKSLANYSFYMGATNDNLDELLKTDINNVCGVKVFMGSSTGNMLVDNRKTLEGIFSSIEIPIAVHCEDEETIQKNTSIYKGKYGLDVPFNCHPKIRSVEACYKSSSLAVELAKKYNTRLHVLHISTEKELELFDDAIPLSEKRITAEVCVHHLWFDESQYDKYGSKIKWNPAVKAKSDKEALRKGLLSGKLDVVATDHAPHTAEEKSHKYFACPSGGPLVQHSLIAMLELYHKGIIDIENVVNKMCHAPADLFNIKNRGYIKEGYFADITIVDLNTNWQVSKNNILYKCGWSPFEGTTFKSKVNYTIVNGEVVYDNGNFDECSMGVALEFNR